jgi:CRP/FNR family transcriptional regulator, cyclic AMP receptor protein
MTTLANVPLFSGLKETDVEVLTKHLVRKRFPKHSVIINEGDTADSLYIIEEGTIKVFLTDEQGKEVLLRTQDPGEYFGELALLDDAPRSASVMTLEPAKFAIISRDAFMACLSKNPSICANLIRDLASRVRSLTENVRSLALLDVYGRIARSLLDLAVEKEGKLVVEQRLTHQEIANRVGASREMVSRIMKDLTKGGYIKMEGKQIVVNERLPSSW